MARHRYPQNNIHCKRKCSPSLPYVADRADALRQAQILQSAVPGRCLLDASCMFLVRTFPLWSFFSLCIFLQILSVKLVFLFCLLTNEDHMYLRTKSRSKKLFFYLPLSTYTQFLSYLPSCVTALVKDRESKRKPTTCSARKLRLPFLVIVGASAVLTHSANSSHLALRTSDALKAFLSSLAIDAAPCVSRARHSRK